MEETYPENSDSASPAKTTDTQSLGQMLKSIRQEQSIGLDTIEAHTKIRQKHLKIIEGEPNLEDKPLPNTYYRGYIRTYCDFFCIDHNEYKKHILEQFPQDDDTEEMLCEFHKQSKSSNHILSKRTKWQLKRQMPYFLLALGMLLITIIMIDNSNKTNVDESILLLNTT